VKIPLALFIGATAAMHATAQTNPYEGQWTAVFQANTRPIEARLVISGTTGTWKSFMRNKENPCAGLEAPITVRTATAEELVFDIEQSKALHGCPDAIATLRSDGASLAGTLGSFPLKLTRK
jgi:hypothetical protein